MDIPLHSVCSGLRLILAALFFAPAVSHAHDMMASHVIARVKPDALELQIKIAADVAWPLVQETSPGVIFVMEDFEKVGRPLLLSLAKKMDTLRIDGKTVEPSRIDVVVAEDTFLFAITYSLPPRGTLQLTENYLGKMSPEYLSRIRIFDQSGAQVGSKELSKDKPVLDLQIPLVKPSS